MSEKIRNFKGALISSNEDELRNMLRDIIELDIAKVSENDLIRIVTPETINLINRALSRNIRIVKKEIRDLYNSIYGRRFRKHDLIIRF